MEQAIFDARLQTSFGMLVCGSPFAGKTSWTVNLLKNADKLIDHQFDYIFWFYGERNPLIEQLEREMNGKLRTVHGLPDNIDDYIIEGQVGCHIYDDLFLELSDSNRISELCAYKTQHAQLSWIILMQNIFHSGKARQTIYRCAHYLCIFNNTLDRSQIYSLAYKLMPGNQKLFLKIFEKATLGKPYGYIFVDGRSTSPQDARFRTDIFGSYQKVFIPQ